MTDSVWTGVPAPWREAVEAACGWFDAAASCTPGFRARMQETAIEEVAAVLRAASREADLLKMVRETETAALGKLRDWCCGPEGLPAAYIGGSVDEAVPAYIAELRREAQELRAQVEADAKFLMEAGGRRRRLEDAIRWACGEEIIGWPSFGDGLPPGRSPGDGKEPRIGRYWWREELRRHADLPYTPRAAGPPSQPSPSEVPVTPLPLVPIPEGEREAVLKAYAEKLFDADDPREDGEEPFDWRERTVLDELFRMGLFITGSGTEWYTLHHWRVQPTFDGQPEDWDGLRFWINYVLGMSPDTPEDQRPVRYDRSAVQAWRMAQDSDLPFPTGR